MRRLALFALLAGIVSVPAIAQEEGKIPTPLPLVARFTDAQGRLLVGGGPEVEEIAAVLGAYVQARVVGTSGAVPLLAQGTISIAVLPRAMTVNERAASRRFAGGAVLAIPVMDGLTAYARRDGDGAADARALAQIRQLLSDETQAQLAIRLGGYRKLFPDDLAAARATLARVTTLPEDRKSVV